MMRRLVSIMARCLLGCLGGTGRLLLLRRGTERLLLTLVVPLILADALHEGGVAPWGAIAMANRRGISSSIIRRLRPAGPSRIIIARARFRGGVLVIIVRRISATGSRAARIRRGTVPI